MVAVNIDPEQLLDQGIFIAQLEEAGFARDEAEVVLREARTMGLAPADLEQFQSHFQNDAGGVDIAKVDAFMRIHNTQMTLDSYHLVLEERADNVENNTSLNRLYTAIEYMYTAGYSGVEIADICNRLIKISKSFTPHPTENLSPNGIRLARNLVAAAEEEEDRRDSALKAAVHEIATSDDFGASKKSNMIDETDYSSECARIHNEGVNELDRIIEHMIYEVTGETVEVHTNTAARSWDYDADGKNNADGFAMMMKICTTTIGAMEDVCASMTNAQTEKVPENLRIRLEHQRERIASVVERLRPVYERSRAITAELAATAPEDREAIYRQRYEEEYVVLHQQLAGAYDHLDRNRGLDFYRETVNKLSVLRKLVASKDEEAGMLVDDSFRTLNRCGFALEKGQTRHNDLVYIEMLDRLFDLDAFWAEGVLDAEDREEVLQAGKFSSLPSERKYQYWEKILDYAKANGNRDKIVQYLRDSNPLSFKPLSEGGNGYPDQGRAYLDRMDLRALFPLKFEEGIISDAQESGSPRQKFVADLFGMRRMKHMALNEDMATLAQQHRLTRKFKEAGGQENMREREVTGPGLFLRAHETLHVMRPASDAERNGGSFTRLQALDQYRKIVREAYKMKVPIEIMIGGGMSLNRFGGDVDIVRRVLAQELNDIFQAKKAAGESLDDYDEKMIIMATSILYTEQGRAKRYLSATPFQVMDDYADKVACILEDYLDMRGDVPNYTFINAPVEFSESMGRLQRDVAEEAIAYYNGFANIHFTDDEGSVTDELILDRYADQAGCPNLLPTQNNGARSAAGKAKGSKKLSALRAIGKDQGLYTMQSFHAGFFSSGRVMKRFDNALQDGRISQSDIEDLTNDPEWQEAIFSRNLIDAGRFNATHLFAQLSNGDASDWTFDRAVAIGKEVVWKRTDGKLHLVYAGDEDVTQEQLYLSKIYYDRLVFLAMTEAALTPKGAGVTMEDDFDKILEAFRPSDNGLEVGLGQRTKEKWPSIEEQTLHDHRKNAPAYALYYMVEEDIAAKIHSGTPKDEVMEEYGQGDPAQAESRFRQYGSALRSGTLPHKAKWMGTETYGMSTRRAINPTDVMMDLQAVNGDVLGDEPDLRQ